MRSETMIVELPTENADGSLVVVIDYRYTTMGDKHKEDGERGSAIVIDIPVV